MVGRKVDSKEVLSGGKPPANGVHMPSPLLRSSTPSESNPLNESSLTKLVGLDWRITADRYLEDILKISRGQDNGPALHTSGARSRQGRRPNRPPPCAYWTPGCHLQRQEKNLWGWYAQPCLPHHPGCHFMSPLALRQNAHVSDDEILRGFRSGEKKSSLSPLPGTPPCLAFRDTRLGRAGRPRRAP